jgi:hypothetical protein
VGGVARNAFQCHEPHKSTSHLSALIVAESRIQDRAVAQHVTAGDVFRTSDCCASQVVTCASSFLCPSLSARRSHSQDVPHISSRHRVKTTAVTHSSSIATADSERLAADGQRDALLRGGESR